MKKFFLIPIMVCLLILGLCCCEKKEDSPRSKEITGDQLKEKAGKLMDTAKDFLHRQKDELLQDFDGQMRGLNKKIEELHAEADKATPEMKEKLQAIVKQLQIKQEGIKKLLDDSKGEVGKAWEDLKSKLDETLNYLEKDLEKDKTNI